MAPIRLTVLLSNLRASKKVKRNLPAVAGGFLFITRFVNINYMLSINKIIRILILSDFLIYSSWGLITPIIAVFINDSIKGGDVGVAGTAAGIYWITKSILQVPIGKYLDRNTGKKNAEKDDYWFMIIGTFIASLTPLMFLISSEPWHIYGLEVIYGAAMAMVIPPWGGIFVRHIDKGREAETFALESSTLGIGVGVAGIVGGAIAKFVGFTPLFIGVSVFGILGTLLLLAIKKDILPREREGDIKHIKIIRGI